jgi:hypothetical protein
MVDLCSVKIEAKNASYLPNLNANGQKLKTGWWPSDQFALFTILDPEICSRVLGIHIELSPGVTFTDLTAELFWRQLRQEFAARNAASSIQSDTFSSTEFFPRGRCDIFSLCLMQLTERTKMFAARMIASEKWSVSLGSSGKVLRGTLFFGFICSGTCF